MAVLSTTMCEEKRALKERLAAIMNVGKYTKPTILMSVLLITVVVLVACFAGAASENNNDWQVEESASGLEDALHEFLDCEEILMPTQEAARTSSSNNERIDLRIFMMRDIDDMRHLLGTQIDSNDGIGMFYQYSFDSGLHVSVNEIGQIMNLSIEYNQTNDLSQFHFDGINGEANYSNVAARLGNNPYNIRAGYDEARVGAVRSYGYFYDWSGFVRFFFDDDENVVSISVLRTAATTEQFVREDNGALAVHGFGGRIYYQRATAERPPMVHFIGKNFPVAQLENEPVEGSAVATQDSLQINFLVARNDIIIDQVSGPLGAHAGPSVGFEYLPNIGINEINHYPFEFDNGHEPLHFEFSQENAIELAQMIKQVLEVVSEFQN